MHRSVRGYCDRQSLIASQLRTRRPRISISYFALRMSGLGRVSRGSPVQTAMRNCTRDEGRSFEAGSQVLASNRCKLLSSKAMVVSVAVNVGRIPAGEVER